jgi:hypothetical protein
MQEILVYSFKKNLSEIIMQNLRNVDYFVINDRTTKKGLQDLEELLNIILKTEYKYIIGIGVNSSLKDRIAFEKEAKNQFRRDKAIESSYNSLSIGEFLESNSDEIIISHDMGTSWCNMTSFSIRDKLIKLNSSSLNGFIHVPKAVENTDRFVNLIQTQITRLIDE